LASRPDSSVVEHFHGKEGVVGSNPTRGSILEQVSVAETLGWVAQLVRAHDS
jgi:hypothetical protein